MNTKDKIDWLSRHNKNYNNDQYFYIFDIKDQIDHVIEGLKYIKYNIEQANMPDNEHLGYANRFIDATLRMLEGDL